ncbi:cobalt-precorrin-5B (C(1))-methyltransferase CbiD [Prochlorococcus marinus]|uniref:cobalt-precorrin-5B (C(1))-methyltransferase CbiD n=1 Tax=Prochlorococcus marinus TaxID=1219 RepID=UPI0022B3CD3D|nr:cobalt-precorrin-5B (C(1))-methyltransferase CbiD [Prochlorococcus marinus]
MRGFTLPVWVVAAAKAAAFVLNGDSFNSSQIIDFSDNEDSIQVPVRSAALLHRGHQALGISFCDPGNCLDLTIDLEIWTLLKYVEANKTFNSDSLSGSSESWLKVIPGFGVGKLQTSNAISISDFAQNLLEYNLRSFKKNGYILELEIIFPEGKKLADRTSNHAFGVVDGLALIGTQANVQISASPDQLQYTIDDLRKKCASKDFLGDLTFVIGENGLNLALQSGLPSKQIIKTGNWIGPLLVASAEEKVKKLILFGYHGKLIKLAGGIFHTHHHLADSRLEILIALAVKEGIPYPLIQSLQDASSIEAALLILENKDIVSTNKLWERIALEVEKRSIEYVNHYFSSSMEIGAVLFDRKRKLRWASPTAFKNIASFNLKLEDEIENFL